jgi:xanthine/uracil permease
MNPLQWRSEHKVALLLGVVVGIALGFVAGYMHHDIRFDNAAAFSSYLTGGSALRWAVFGALIGATIIYIQQLLHK